jgi:hypothetical protein
VISAENVELSLALVEILPTVIVETKVVTVVTWKITVAAGQISDSLAVDAGGGPDGDEDVVVRDPLLVDVGTDPEGEADIVVNVPSLVDDWTPVDGVGEEMPVAMQEHAEEMRVGSK